VQNKIQEVPRTTSVTFDIKSFITALFAINALADLSLLLARNAMQLL